MEQREGRFIFAGCICEVDCDLQRFARRDDERLEGGAERVQVSGVPLVAVLGRQKHLAHLRRAAVYKNKIELWVDFGLVEAGELADKGFVGPGGMTTLQVSERPAPGIKESQPSQSLNNHGGAMREAEQLREQ